MKVCVTFTNGQERRLLVLRDIEKVSPGALIRELARVRRCPRTDSTYIYIYMYTHVCYMYN